MGNSSSSSRAKVPRSHTPSPLIENLPGSYNFANPCFESVIKAGDSARSARGWPPTHDMILNDSDSEIEFEDVNEDLYEATATMNYMTNAEWAKAVVERAWNTYEHFRQSEHFPTIDAPGETARDWDMPYEKHVALWKSCKNLLMAINRDEWQRHAAGRFYCSVADTSVEKAPGATFGSVISSTLEIVTPTERHISYSATFEIDCGTDETPFEEDLEEEARNQRTLEELPFFGCSNASLPYPRRIPKVRNALARIATVYLASQIRQVSTPARK
jgi:hypothetical protein